MSAGAPPPLSSRSAKIARRLIDDPKAALADPGVRAAIDADAALRDLALSLEEVAPSLESLGQAQLTQVPPGLRAKVRALGEEHLTWRPWWARTLDVLFGPTGRWATVAACLLVALMVGTAIHRAGQAPIGQVSYAQIPIRVEGSDRHVSSHSPLERGTRLVSAEGGAVLTIGEVTRVAVDANSDLAVLETDTLQVNRGRLYLRLADDEPIRVSAAGVEIRGRAATFGVDLTSGGTIIDVTEGEVEVAMPGQTVTVRSQQAFSVGDSAPTLRAGGGELPAWVAVLLEAERREHVGQFIPSAGGP